MAYSYLIMGLLATGAGLAAAHLLPAARWFVIAAGLLAAPAGLADVIFVPEYWRPVHLIGPWFSVEGLLFSFGNGALIAALIAWRFPALRLRPPERFVVPWARCVALMALGFAVFLVFWQRGFGSLMIMHAAFVGFLAMFLALRLRGWFSLRVGLVGGAGFAAVYALQTLVWHWLDPAVARFWPAESGYLYVLPVPPFLPVEEFFWAFLYGALWSSLMLFSFNARLPESAGISRT
jgi:hypothetical protein